MHFPTIATLISCVFVAKAVALPTPGSVVNSRDIAVISVREDTSVAAVPPSWKHNERGGVPPDWRRSADASARDTRAVPPAWKREVPADEASLGSPDWKREVSADAASLGSPDWKRDVSTDAASLGPPDWKREPSADAASSGSPDWKRDVSDAKFWRRSQAKEYPTSPAWRQESSP